MNDQQHLDTLQDIKKIMERSSRFISLSGLSGVAAGFCGLAGAFFAQRELINYAATEKSANIYNKSSALNNLENHLMVIAVLTLLAAFTLGFLFTFRRAKKNNLPIWDSSSRKLLGNLFIPLLTGGIFILLMIYHHIYIFTGAACLIFYGLSLVNASKYTLNDIRYLGYLEIITGIINMISLHYTLYFWAFGFGLLHIIYGLVMWNKYEKVIKAA